MFGFEGVCRELNEVKISVLNTGMHEPGTSYDQIASERFWKCYKLLDCRVRVFKTYAVVYKPSKTYFLELSTRKTGAKYIDMGR